MRNKVAPIVGVVIVVALAGSFAGAHEDYNDDGPNDSETRCDTWYRTDHEAGDPGEETSHEHEDEFDNGEVVPGVYVHNHTGHYGVRGDGFYVEVVGGGGYSNGEGNQGGYVQGEVDLMEGAPDADFHTSTFSGTDGSMHEENLCLSVADNKIGDEGEQP